jgi:hypothetical protein
MRIRKLTEDELREKEEVEKIKQDPLEFEEITKEMTPEDLDTILGLTIKRDNINKRIHFLAAILTYTDEDQINLANRGFSSSGKSYIILEIVCLYFPKSDVIIIAYASPTAFFHELGEWDEEKKVYYVNLERKILIFLDQPHDELLRRLRPVLSHDQKELMVKITDKREKRGLRTKSVMIRGYPTVVFCSGHLRMDEQEATRCIALSPETTIEKIWEAILLKALRKGNPPEYTKMLEADENRERLRKRVLLIKYAGIRNIVIENPEERIAKRFIDWIKTLNRFKGASNNSERLKPRHTRDIERIISIAKAFALLNLWHRRREGDTLYVEQKDIDWAFELYEEIAESQELGIPPCVYQVYKEVFEPLYWEKCTTLPNGEEEGGKRSD